MSITAARPVVERIAVVLFERLQKLAAGYAASTWVPEVIRPTRFGGWTPKHLQIVLTQSDPVEVPELACPGNPPSIAFLQMFNIRCHINPSEKDPTPIEEYINTMTADVVRAVCGNDNQWRTFGGLAINAQWQDREFIDNDGSFGGVNVPLAVTYRTSESDPYQLRA